MLDEETEEYNKRQEEKTEKEARSFLKVKQTFSLFPPYSETKDQYDKRTKDWEIERKLYKIPYPRSFGTSAVANTMSSNPAMSYSDITVVPKSKKSTGSQTSTTRRRITKRPEIEFKSAEMITSEDDKMVQSETQLTFPLEHHGIQPITPQETPIRSFAKGVGKRSQKGEPLKVAVQRLLGMFSPKLRPQDTTMAGGIEEVIAGLSTPVSQRKPIGGGRPPIRIRASETPKLISLLEDHTLIPELENILPRELEDLKQKCNLVLAQVQEEFTRQRDAVDQVYQQAMEAQSQAKGQLGLINSLMVKLTETAEKADNSAGALRETVEYVKSLRADDQREFSLLESKDKDPEVFSGLKAELLKDANEVWVKIVNDRQEEMVSVLKGIIEDVTNDKIQQSKDISGK